jgi:hydrophobic/amphiphilic exporter-1 (mainly G- bacteria), HAE1 family
MTITELAVKRPSLIVVIFSVLTFLGIFSYMTLGYELMPKFSLPIITITTQYPGASPKEVETSVSKKIEDAVATMEGIATIRSISQESFSTVIVEFGASTKIDDALLDAQRKLNAVVSQLPSDAKTPSVSKISFTEAPIIRMGVAGKVSPTELFDIVKQRIVPALTKLNGVGAVDLVGGEEREIRVNVNKKKLEAYNLSILQVSQAIQKSNLDFPTGKIKTQENQNLIRLAGKFKSLQELKNVIVATDRTSSPIYLHQVAEIQDTQKEIEKITHVDGNNSIGLMVRKQSDANAVEVKKQVMKELEIIEKMYAKQGIKFSIAQDTTEFTMKAADAVIEDLLLAVLLVAGVMLLFLHSWRNALIVMIAIPASIVSTFIAMFVMGFTLNLMTLLALSLVVGILVDDSIVVLENIHRHLEMGKDPRTASLDGRQEIGFSAMSITLVDVVVFLPIALVSGLISNILRQFSLVVVISTLMSLFVSFTVTPLLASRFSKAEHLNPKTFFGAFIIWFERQIDTLTNVYISLLKISLRYKLLTLIVAFGLFFSSFLLGAYGYIGSEFVTQGDRGEFIVNIELPKDATVEQTNRISQKVEKLLFENKYIKNIFTTVGATSELVGGQATVYKAELNVKLVEREERPHPTSIMSTLIRNEIAEKVAGAKITTSEMGFTGQANNAPLQFVVTGNNNDSLFKYANLLRDKISKIPGTVNIKLSAENGNPEISVQIDKKRMSDLGLSMDAVGATMQNAFSGNDKSEYEDGDYNYDINVKLDDFDRKNIDDVSSIIFVNNQGQNIKLSQFAQINQTTGASKLERRSRMSSVVIEGQVLGRTVGDVGADIDKIVANTKMPTDIVVSKDGDLKRQGEAFGSLGFALIASILFMYLIMVALYDSYVYPFVVLFSIPVAIMGALLALALTMSSLSIFSMLGMIMLVGLVAKNAILLVDFANQMKEERGMKTYEALIEAGKTRLRPILMTTIAMVLGMLPIALAKGAGAEWKNGLAWALIGGLSSSMLLTLVVVPVMYSIVDSMIEFVNKIFGINANPKPNEPLASH